MMRQTAVATALIALAACGGGSFSAAPTPTPSSALVACWFSGSAPASTLVSPAPGATGVPDSTSTLIFSSALETPFGAPGIEVAFGTGDFYLTSTVTATASGYSVPLPALVSHTTYTVTALFTVPLSESSCGTLPVVEGSFTTQ
ncbi:MAG TPA: hypothetical protein VMG98_08680 [Verrucomicrobiae bacterium]|nr:hypothetical protein [Verrucomicrobiae bacterium]